MIIGKIPEPTINRLSIYARYLSYLARKGESFITSAGLGKKVHIDSAQVRRDLAYFGRFGLRGKGYEIQQLCRELRRILGLDRIWPVGLIGAGNLGRALFGYPGFRQHGFRISAIFDNSPGKIGKSWEGIEIQDVKDIPRVVKEKGIEIAIIAVPSYSAQQVTDILLRAGVKAILNFAPYKLAVPKKVKVKNIDLATELQSLSCFLTK